jgi:phosphohistidine swiveling domain-containing protein
MWTELSHEKRGHIQPTLLYWLGASKACKLVGFPGKLACWYKDNEFSYLVEKGVFEKAGKEILNRLIRNDDFLNEIIKNNEQKIPEMLQAAEALVKAKNFKSWQEWQQKFIDMMILSVMGTVMEMETPVLSNELESILVRKLGKDNPKVGEYFQVLTTPTELTISQKEEVELLKLKTDSQIKDHTKKYSFIAFGYGGPGWSEADIRKRLDDLPEDAIKEKENARIELREKQNSIIQELSLSIQEQSLFETLRVLGFWKFERKLLNQKAHWLMESLFEHIAKINNVSLAEAKMLLPEEIEDALNKNTDRYALKERSECLVVFEGDEYKLYGKDTAILKIIHQDLSVNTDVSEIRGATAFPGFASGLVKIVDTAEDMAKFNEGDILVSASTSVQILPVMKKAAAIITDTGGITCHAAIVAREIKTPTVIGTRIATKVLKDNDFVEVDAGKGLIKIKGEKMAKNILWFNEISKKDVPLVGGKGASLGEMSNHGFPVPPGFCVTAQAYEAFLDKSGAKKEIFEILKKNDVDKTEQLQKASDKIRDMIIKAKMPDDIKKDIVSNYAKLDGFVAVRSSATAEDLPDASFAGQQDTYLNVKGSDDVVRNVQKCWASLFMARAIFYREKNKFQHDQVLISVVIQKMINSDSAGVMFTINPVTNSDEELIIEGAFGLGEAVVAGMVNPDNYVVDKKSLRITNATVNEKKFGIFRGKDGKNFEKKFSPSEANKRVLTDAQIKELAKIGNSLEKHYGWPQDTEWAIEAGTIYMTQSRPITTYKKQAKKPETKQKFSLDMDFF